MRRRYRFGAALAAAALLVLAPVLTKSLLAQAPAGRGAGAAAAKDDNRPIPRLPTSRVIVARTR